MNTNHDVMLPPAPTNTPSQTSQIILDAMSALVRGDESKALAILGQAKQPLAALAEYERLDREVKAASELFDHALQARSNYLKALVDQHGPGPFRIQDQNVIVMSRPNGTKKRVTYFLRSVKD